MEKCHLCGCHMDISTVTDGICEVCQDDLDECNPYTQWMKEFEE